MSLYIKQIRDDWDRVTKRSPDGEGWRDQNYVQLCVDEDQEQGYEGIRLTIDGILPGGFIVLDKAEARLVAEQLLNYADDLEGA